MDINEAKELRHRDVVHDDACKRWYVNGQIKETRPNEFRLPLKHGLYTYGYMTDANSHMFHKEEDCRRVTWVNFY